MDTINDFRQSKYNFLMNSYDSPVEFEGETYPTVEHAYQAAKTVDLSDRLMIKQAHSARRAKRIGREITIRLDWDNMREDIMFELLERKFTDKKLAFKLLATQNATLVSGGDTFWGIVNGFGENKLGVLLMKVRAGIVFGISDTIKEANRIYLTASGWVRRVDGDNAFTECWVPSWNNECYFDIDSAVHYQNKINAGILQSAQDMDFFKPASVQSSTISDSPITMDANQVAGDGDCGRVTDPYDPETEGIW